MIFDKLQNSIVDLLWKNRPMWRSKWLVLGLLGSPFRVDPYIARSFQVLVECIIFLKERNDSQRAVWQNQFEAQTVSNTSVISIFSIGLRRIGFEVSMPFYLQFRECDPISVLNFGNRELRIFLQSITRTICYNKAANIVRKDILPTNGVLHSQLSLYGTRTSQFDFERLQMRPRKCSRND